MAVTVVAAKVPLLKELTPLLASQPAGRGDVVVVLGEIFAPVTGSSSRTAWVLLRPSTDMNKSFCSSRFASMPTTATPLNVAGLALVGLSMRKRNSKRSSAVVAVPLSSYAVYREP